jgi:hypothetical protein
MRIETITCIYNEEFLLPFYMKHYDFVDQYNILYDIKSEDRTLAFLKRNKKVKIIPVNYPGGFNSLMKQMMIHDVYNDIKEDSWVLNVDCDEFAFLKKLPDKQSIINKVAFYNVFRHIDDCDLSVKITIKKQRCHGVLDENYVKPILTLSGLAIEWIPGCHKLTEVELQEDAPVHCKGAHWENADTSFCIERRCKDRNGRQSKYNIWRHYGVQNHHVTEESIIDLCKAHEQDPKLW